MENFNVNGKIWFNSIRGCRISATKLCRKDSCCTKECIKSRNYSSCRGCIKTNSKDSKVRQKAGNNRRRKKKGIKKKIKCQDIIRLDKMHPTNRSRRICWSRNKSRKPNPRRSHSPNRNRTE